MMINICGGYYIFDINKIVDFFNYSDNAQTKETEILENYELDTSPRVANRSIRELTTTGSQQIDSIKYDLLKTFIFQVIGYINERPITDWEDLPFGVQISVNTLIHEKFLIEVKQ